MARSPLRLVVAHGRVPAHNLLRAEAARFHGVRPEQVVVVHRCERCGREAHGRPVLLATSAIREPAHVSVARAGEVSVVAVTDAAPVGVDVEVDGAAGFEGFADVVLHPAEREAPATDPTRAWVRKEALLKAYGLGLAVDPSQVRLDGTVLAAWESAHPRPAAVWLRDLDVPGLAVSVALLPESVSDLADLAVSVAGV